MPPSETVRRRKDGKLIDVSVNFSPVRNRAGQVLGTSVIAQDITEKKRLQEQFRQAQKMEAIGRLAGGIAHDFNNLLTVILGCADQVSRAEFPDDVRQDLGEMVKAGHSAAALTRQLLAFSRRQILEPSVIDLNQVIAKLGGMLDRLIGDDVELRLHQAAHLSAIRADAGQVEQIVLNLAVNARDAMPHGGLLTIETANVTLDHPYVAEHHGASVGPHIMLAVTDTGYGMDEATRDRLFEPFFTTKERDKGTGLGLATVYGIVSHGVLESGLAFLQKPFTPVTLAERVRQVLDAPGPAGV